MINFLRRIRRNMVTEKKSDLYLVYAIGEVVLVVLGILIALQIDSWNENKKVSSIEQQYLLALKEEFEFNRTELASVMNLNGKYTDAALEISDFTGPGNPEITEKEFETLAMNAFATEVHYNPNQGVLDEIISSGKLGIFKNDELKFALSSWSAVLDRALWQERTHETIRVQIVEMTRVHGNIRSMTSDIGERYDIKPTKFERRSRQLLNSEEYENRVIAFILTGRILNENHYATVEEEIDKLLMLVEDEIDATSSLNTETFTFSSNGTATKGKIFLSAAYETSKNLPAIYLIDFTEQQFKLATDEFEKVISGVEQIQGLDALVVTLEEHLDIDSKPEAFQEYYDIFRNMTAYVDGKYTSNTSRTFIGKGSEGGIVLMTLFLESSESSVFENFVVSDSPGSFNPVVMQMIEKDDFPKNKLKKKLHFSFSTSNNRDECISLINMIEEAQYPWLQFESIEYTNSNYENTYPVSFAAGIEYIFTE